MLSDAGVFYLVLIGIATLVVAFRAWLYLVASHRKAGLYKLYAVRDRFVQLVAQGELKEGGVVFESFYGAINMILRQGGTYNVRHMVATIKQISKGLTENDVERLKQLKMEVATARPHVKRAIGAYFVATFELLMANSLVLKVILHCLSLLVRLNRICRLPKPESYSAYSANSALQKALHLA